MFDGIPIDLYEALLVLSFLNGLVLIVGGSLPASKQAVSRGFRTAKVMRKISGSQLFLVSALIVLPFLIMGGLAGSVSVTFLVQRGWLYQSSDTEPWMIIVGLSTGILCLYFALIRSITNSASKKAGYAYVTNIHKLIDQIAVPTAFVSGTISVLIIALSFFFGRW